MAKTDKFNAMIEAFECDFVLAKEGKYEISELDNKVKFKDEKLMKDIDLLEELSYLLRYGKAEIHLTEEPTTQSDLIRSFSDEELAEFLCKISMCKPDYCTAYYKCMRTEYGTMKEWLQSEVNGSE